MNIEHLAHDLFLLMLNLSQLRSQERILTIFLEAMNSIRAGASFRLLAEGESVPSSAVEIATTKSAFGHILLEGDTADLTDEFLSLARNAIGMLAIVLENRAQETLLADENLRLETAVKERTSKLLRVNERLQSEITERKRTEESLRESEERYHSLFDDVPVGLYRTTPDGQFLDANPAFIEMLGYPDRESLLAADAVDLQVNAGDRQRWQALLEREGTLRGYEGSMEDITERKQMEEQLRQQERLAAVGQLAGGIAHDFNNLLATIILYSQMTLGKHDLPPDVAQALETILAESRRAAKLVQQILDFSRSSMMATRPVDLVSFTEGVFAILRRTIPENIRLVLAMGPEEYVVEADPTRIQQALMNLALNARDAMLPKGGGKLHVGLSRVTLKPGEDPPVAEMDSGEWARLTVSDTGTGMTEEVQAHLFEPFFTTKKPGKGTGLGLAQVYGIVKQHEGHIGVETAAGEGSTFRIYLPVYEEEKTAEVEAKEPSALPRGRGETILVVEDEARLRKAVGEILESLGYRVLTAADGREALEAYRSAAEVDLVLADLVMPEMGGKQLIRELKQEHPDLKALAITGYVMDVDLQDLKQTGFLGVVNKPFDVDRLAKIVRRALDLDETTQW